MARDVYIVRHGNTFDKGDTVTRVGARTDLDLSVSGQQQAEALAHHFKQAGIVFSSATAGPLKRTLQTARTILATQPEPIELTVSEFLREIDYGPDENQPEPVVIDRIGDAALSAWEHYATAPPGWIVDPEALETAWKDFFKQLYQSEDERPALVVTSNGIARFALLAVTREKAPTDLALKLKTGAYGVIHLGEDGPALKDWNFRP
ncbi:histidine phosphatase family protein [Henriciella sp. AS95]|uniref:histidine phosphatase family protein n=1 Tax=Henriciella sp. AS95 TaxID=3135782 RepID=UPI00316FC19F